MVTRSERKKSFFFLSFEETKQKNVGVNYLFSLSFHFSSRFLIYVSVNLICNSSQKKNYAVNIHLKKKLFLNIRLIVAGRMTVFFSKSR